MDNTIRQEALTNLNCAISLVSDQPIQASTLLESLISDYSQWGIPLFLLCEMTLKNQITPSPDKRKFWFKSLSKPAFQFHHIALYLRAWNADTQGCQKECVQLLTESLKLKKDFRQAMEYLSSIKLKEEDWKEAESLLRQQLQYSPEQAHLLQNLAVALLRQNQLQEALIYGQKALVHALPEQYGSVHVNIGSILQELNHRNEAREHYLKAIALNPNHLNAHLNLGVLYFQEKDLANAENKFRQTLQLDPTDLKASVNLAGVLLLTNRAKEGWFYYEKRLYKGAKILDAPLEIPQWKGEKLEGSLLLVHEQGLGDSFQFIRYSALLRERGINCYFRGPLKLHNLFISSNLIKSCFTEAEPLPKDAKAWVALMSLPPMFEASVLDPKTSKTPYLKVDSNKINQWASILGRTKRFRVALHWQGNPDHEFTIARGRSIPLKLLMPLLQIDGVEWISLQKGPGSEQANCTSFVEYWHPKQKIINDAWGFEDAAAILATCDALVSSDSGLAHLAGALGTSVYLMLPWLAEWRWGLENRFSEWYPQHKIYRQPKENDWASVIKEVRYDLKAKVGSLKDINMDRNLHRH